MSKLWGGRFTAETNALVHKFNASIHFDKRLYDEDITGSIAWAHGLQKAGLLTDKEASTIVEGLEQVRLEFINDLFAYHPDDEDIHTAVERRLIELTGTMGGKLHTGRSRNDQVATDFRLWVMRAVDKVLTHIAALQEAVVENAAQHLDLPMPGYTHLQHAQPVTWGHWILSFFWPLARDRERWLQVRQSAAVLPLGAAALAGTAFNIDRQALAAELGFKQISQNSIDAVSDRDFAADFLYAAAMTGLHLGRLSEQLILFNSAEFGFIRLDDAFSTGSSIMPQKKNPDTLELTRGKSGRLIGNLTGLLATLKGLPSTYDKDLQEDKEPVFDAFDTLEFTLPVMTGLIQTLQLQPARIAQQLEPGLLATEMADYLVKQGVPFREAHGLVGQAVHMAEVQGQPLNGLSLADLQTISPHFNAGGVVNALQIQTALAQRAVMGGTAPSALQEQLSQAQRYLQKP
jgi:argininosuccinate lyase